MSNALRGAAARLAARVIGSSWTKPVARAVLVAAGLLLLALIGRNAVAGALAARPQGQAANELLAATAPQPAPAPPSAPAPAPPPPPASAATASASPTTPPPEARRVPASSDDPVVLNTASFEDLRRLPGIGQKRADAILTLRSKLGSFRAVEDLLQVKGIGRAMLKRLRPLVRLYPAPRPDAAAPASSAATAPAR